MRKTLRVMGLWLVCMVSFSPALLGQEQDQKILQEKKALEQKDTAASKLANQERFEEAVAIWLAMLGKLDDKSLPGVYRKLGLAYKMMGLLPESWHYLTSYLESSGKEDTTAGGWLQEVETALKQTHVKVSFSCQPEGLTLSVPYSRSGAATQPSFRIPHSTFAWWFKPGKHAVKATAPGHKPRTVEVDVRVRGDSGVREIRLATVETIVKPAEPKKPSRGLEWALIGSGLALGAAGGIFHGIGYSKNEDIHTKYLDTTDYPDDDEAQELYDEAYGNEVRPKKIAAYVLYGIGGAAIVAGAITWAVRKPVSGQAESAGFTVTPLALPGGTGALLSLEF